MSLQVCCGKYLPNLIFKSSTVLVALLVLSGCSDNDQLANPSNNETTEQPTKSLEQMLVTNIGEDFHQAWVCFDNVGEPTGHTFYDKGTIEGFPTQYLGSEYSIRSNIAPFHYTWSLLSRDSISIESPPLGLQDHWSKVMFLDYPDNNRRLMKATSRSRGQLYCSLKGHKQ